MEWMRVRIREAGKEVNYIDCHRIGKKNKCKVENSERNFVTEYKLGFQVTWKNQ